MKYILTVVNGLLVLIHALNGLFSLQYRKVIGLALLRYDRLKNLAPLFL